MPLTFWVREGLRDFSTTSRNDRVSRVCNPCIIFSSGLLNLPSGRSYLTYPFGRAVPTVGTQATQAARTAEIITFYSSLFTDSIDVSPACNVPAHREN